MPTSGSTDSKRYPWNVYIDAPSKRWFDRCWRRVAWPLVERRSACALARYALDIFPALGQDGVEGLLQAASASNMRPGDYAAMLLRDALVHRAGVGFDEEEGD